MIEHLNNRAFSHIFLSFPKQKGIRSSLFSLFNFSINILVCLLSITKYHFPSQLILMIDSQTTHAGAFGLIDVHHVSLLTLNWLLSHLIFYCVSTLYSSLFHLCCANAKYIFLTLHYFYIAVSLLYMFFHLSLVLYILI